MDQINLKSFVAKLNDTCRRTLEAAAGLCLSRTNYNVEIEHWLLKLLEAPNTDLAALLRQFEIDPSRLSRDLTRVVDGFKTGNARTPALSPNIISLVREAWVTASIEFGSMRIRSAHLLCALLSDKSLGMVAYSASSEFEKINTDALHKDLLNIVANTDEAATDYAATADMTPGAPGQPLPPGGATKTPSLDQFTINLTERARRGGNRSGAGPRSRNPPDRRHPHPAATEQPHHDRRGRRGQDRRRRRIRHPDRRGRRAAGAKECRHPNPRPRAVAGGGPASRENSRTGSSRSSTRSSDPRNRSSSSSTRPTP